MEQVRRADGDVPPISRPRVVVLTREVHRAGRWVTALATALADRLRDVDAVVEIVCVERAAADASLLPAGGGRPQCALLVNRVSDAAPPATAKAAAALLHCMELHAIPVVNGARCFAIGNNKLLHQQVLSQAGCAVPRSVAVALEPGADRYQRRAAVDSAASSLLAAGAAFPLLIKPNSGGFGQGVVPMRSLDDLLRWSDEDDAAAARSADGMSLLQEYIEPLADATYRVWFHRGRVVAAVQLVLDPSLPLSEALRGGCVGGAACALPARAGSGAVEGSGPTATDGAPASGTMMAWKPPGDVCARVLRAADLAGADCGSVELLYPRDAQGDGAAPVFFDLNMLSALPESGHGRRVHGAEELWGAAWDFYAELAEYILTVNTLRVIGPRPCIRSSLGASLRASSAPKSLQFANTHARTRDSMDQHPPALAQHWLAAARTHADTDTPAATAHTDTDTAPWGTPPGSPPQERASGPQIPDGDRTSDPGSPPQERASGPRIPDGERTSDPGSPPQERASGPRVRPLSADVHRSLIRVGVCTHTPGPACVCIGATHCGRNQVAAGRGDPGAADAFVFARRCGPGTREVS